jgi:AcrR family transcriptional regulator
LTRGFKTVYNLNVFKTTPTPKSETTRKLVLKTALRLFRQRGFDETTMRDIATEAALSLGAAYYYFPTKEAIVVAYYDQVQTEHERATQAELAMITDLRARIRMAFHAKLDIIAKDRALLGALFRHVGNPKDALSVFGPQTKPLRDESIATFAAALGDPHLPTDLRTVAPALLWFIHLGLIFYMLYDDSKDLRRTRALADAAADLFVGLLTLARLPGFGALRRRALNALRAAEVF